MKRKKILNLESLAIRDKFIIFPAFAGVSLIVIGTIIGDPAVIGNLLFIAIFVASVPYFVYRYSEYLKIKSYENQFPNFIRDMADAIRSGMSFSEAIAITSRSNYGKLTQQIIKIKNRLSWGIPVLRVLEIFGKEVKKSKIITEALSIIKQSYETGGDIASTLEAISADMVLLKEAEAERESVVRQHVLIMYGLFYMFLAVAIMIIIIMVPILETQIVPSLGAENLGGYAFTNPCEGVILFPCDYYNAVSSMFTKNQGIGSYYMAMFFTVVMLQGLFSGLIAGQLGQNSIVAGGKHSLIMVFSSIGVFMFLAKAGFLPI